LGEPLCRFISEKNQKNIGLAGGWLTDSGTRQQTDLCVMKWGKPGIRIASNEFNASFRKFNPTVIQRCPLGANASLVDIGQDFVIAGPPADTLGQCNQSPGRGATQGKGSLSI
jgi:hypothetical protein